MVGGLKRNGNALFAPPSHETLRATSCTSEILCHVEEGHLAFFREAQHVVQTSDLILVSNNLDLVFGVVGIKELAKLQKLEWLMLDRTKVTKAGVAELKKALPNCKIEGRPWVGDRPNPPRETP